MVFQTEMGHVIAQGEQEMISAIMALAKQCAGLGHKLRKMARILGLQIQCFRAVSYDVEEVWRVGARRQFHALEVGACDHRRIHQCLQRYRRELDHRAAFIGSSQSGAEVPTCR